MSRKLQFIDSLGLDLSNKAEEAIKSNLLNDLYQDMDQDSDLTGDRRYASMSDIQEVREAFNAFYKLTPNDEEYLD